MYFVYSVIDGGEVKSATPREANAEQCEEAVKGVVPANTKNSNNWAETVQRG